MNDSVEVAPVHFVKIFIYYKTKGCKDIRWLVNKVLIVNIAIILSIFLLLVHYMPKYVLCKSTQLY